MTPHKFYFCINSNITKSLYQNYINNIEHKIKNREKTPTNLRQLKNQGPCLQHVNEKP